VGKCTIYCDFYRRGPRISNNNGCGPLPKNDERPWSSIWLKGLYAVFGGLRITVASRRMDYWVRDASLQGCEVYGTNLSTFRKCIIWKCCLTISKIKCFRCVVWGGRESWRFRVPHPYSSVRVTKPWETTSNLEYDIVSTGFCFHLQGSHWNWWHIQKISVSHRTLTFQASCAIAHPYWRILAWYPEPREDGLTSQTTAQWSQNF
jgi:hypothetical protein